MRKLYLLFPFLLAVISLKSQQPVTLTADSIAIGNKNFPALKATIPEADMANLKKEWKSALESRTKSKVVEENNQWTIFDADGGKISPTPVNVYTQANNVDSVADLLVAIELKKDEFVLPGSPAYTEMENKVRKFSYDQYLYKVNKDLEREEDKLKDLKKQFSTVEDNKSDLKKDVKDAESSITDKEDQIKQLDAQIDNLSGEINKENAQLGAMPDGPAKDQKEKYIKELEKQRKKMVSDRKSAQSRISKSEKAIKEADQQMPDNDAQSQELNQKIEEQISVVRKYTEKADAVKKLAEQ